MKLKPLLRWILIAFGVVAIFLLSVVAGAGALFAFRDVMTPRPRAIEVDTIERRLAALPCVGALSQWQRTYYYDVQCWDCALATPVSHRPRNLDLIYIEYRQAELTTFEDRRVITTVENLDETFYHWSFETRGVSATYEPSSGRLIYECWTSPPSG